VKSLWIIPFVFFRRLFLEKSLTRRKIVGITVCLRITVKLCQADRIDHGRKTMRNPASLSSAGDRG
jgi:hypothetical protein